MNWIKLIHTRGDKKIRYSTIEPSWLPQFMAKLYSHIIEQKISSLVENHHKEAFGQMVFKLKHSIVDYLITLRVTIEENPPQGKLHYMECYVLEDVIIENRLKEALRMRW